MKSLLPTTLLTLLALTFATPLPTHHTTNTTTAPYDYTPHLSKRLPTQSGVYMCVNSNFGGYCRDVITPFNLCADIPQDLKGKVSSVGPDVGSLCSFWTKPGCDIAGGEILGDVFYPGRRDLPKSMNDKISSFLCRATGWGEGKREKAEGRWENGDQRDGHGGREGFRIRRSVAERMVHVWFWDLVMSYEMSDNMLKVRNTWGTSGFFSRVNAWLLRSDHVPIWNVSNFAGSRFYPSSTVVAVRVLSSCNSDAIKPLSPLWILAMH